MSDLQNDNYGQGDYLHSWDGYNGGNPPWKKSMDDILAEQEARERQEEPPEPSGKDRRKKDKKSNKSKKKKKRRKKHYFLRFLVILGIIVGTIVFLSSDFFAINIIMVENNEHFTDSEIIQMSGATPGENLLKTKKRVIRKNLTESPYIDNVNILKRLPRTLVIDVTEREAVMAFQIGQQYVITDKNGMVMEVADSTQGATLMVGLKPITYEIGETVTFDDPIIWKQMYNLAQKMADSGMYFKQLEYTDPLVKGYVLDGLIFQGLPRSLIDNMEAIKVVLYELNQMSITRGIVNIGEDGYASFSPDVGSNTDQSVQSQIQGILNSNGLAGSKTGQDTGKDDSDGNSQSDNKPQTGDSGTGVIGTRPDNTSGSGTSDSGSTGSGTSPNIGNNSHIQSLGDVKDLINQLAEENANSKAKDQKSGSSKKN